MCRRGCCSTLGAYKLRTFLLTFFSYVSFHVTRKVFSVIKSNLSDAKWFGAAGDTGAKLGLLDGLFLFAYAVGLFVAGACGDNFPLVRVLLAGMWASGLVVIAFGVLGFMDVHALWAYAALWTVNGLVQATGWPANVAVMGNWFGRSERGAVLGLWSANASVGNIVGTAVAALLISVIGASAGWKWSMVAAGGIIIIEGAAVLAWLVPHPTRLGFPDPNAVSDTTDSEASGLLNSVKKAPDPVDVDALPAISVLDAWRIPGVLAYALSYACLKSANYACFFWLPLFLHNRYGMSDSQSDLVSMLYDAGQVVGGYVAGAITDRMGVRSPVAIVMMLMSAATVYLFNGASELRIMILLAAAGFLMGGPANMISATISADLGTHPMLMNNAKALSTVTGLIDGTGSIGAAVVQFLVGWLKDKYVKCVELPNGTEHCTHWDPIFIMLVVCNVLAALCLVRVLRTEIGLLFHRRRLKRALLGPRA